MEFLKNISTLLSTADDFVSTKNYYYESHDCKINGTIVKVDLKYKIKDNNSDKIVLFGVCPHCKTLFYHEDFEVSRI